MNSMPPIQQTKEISPTEITQETQIKKHKHVTTLHIGITGHRKIDPRNLEDSRSKAETLVLYGQDNNAIFHIGGDYRKNGWDLIVALTCLKHGVPYILHLPFKEYLQKLPDEIIQSAMQYTWITESHTGSHQPYFDRNTQIVDACSELHCWWDGRLEGGTYKTMIEAKAKNKFIKNWFNLEVIQR